MTQDVAFADVLATASSALNSYETFRAADAPTTTTGLVSYAGIAELSEFETGETNHVYSALGIAEIEVDFDDGGIRLDVSGMHETNGRVVPALLNDESIDEITGSSVAGGFSMNVDPADISTAQFSGSITKTTGEEALYTLLLQGVEAWGPNDEVFEGAARGTSTADGRAERDALLVFIGER